MQTREHDFHYESYRRVPMNSATTHKDFTDYNSVGTISTYNIWPRPLKRTITTTYIDGTAVLGRNERPYTKKDSFPKGKGRRKPYNFSGYKMEARAAYMSLLPIEASIIRTEKPRSPRSVPTETQPSRSLPEVLPKSAIIQHERLATATIFDEPRQFNLYARCATTHANGAWIRRYKSITESQVLSTFLRDHQADREKIPLKKRSYLQLLAFSSPSSTSFTSSLIKSSETIESIGTHSQSQINDDSNGGEGEDQEYHELDMTGRIVANNYRIQSKLGAGSFGQVYLCEHIYTHQQWAIKVESSVMNNNPQLSVEHKIYTILQGELGFPKIDYFGNEGTFDILVIELLGPSLEDLFNYCERQFTLKTAVMLVDQMISRIEYVHACHLIHRDIKPDNFLMGIRSTSNVVYIIDFGLSKRYRDPQSLVHVPWKSNKSLTGTARYASINAHKGGEQSRRDDLEAISYVFMYFLMGTLPWQGLQATAKKAKFERIAEMKMKMTPEQICKNHPKECALFLTYCRNLVFDCRPDYDYLRHLFQQLLYQKSEQYDYEYDWITAYRHKQAVAIIPVQPETSAVVGQ